MRIGITGGTGFIGSALCRKLTLDGHQLVLFGRNRDRSLKVVPEAHFVRWSSEQGFEDTAVLRDLDAFVHLAGEPIAAGRWSDRRKQRISDSRIVGTRNLLDGFRHCGDAPRVLVSSSAIGFYGSRGDVELDESSSPGEGFLPKLSVSWEGEASPASDLGSRVILLRTGLVLSASGGALSKMLLPFKLGLGGRLGSGRQFMSWIHIDDEIRLIDFALQNDSIKGPLNATAPGPVTNQEFTRELGRALRRPTFLPVPSFVLTLAFGEMAQALLLEGQRVLPKKALDAGFQFRFTELRGALEDLLP